MVEYTGAVISAATMICVHRPIESGELTRGVELGATTDLWQGE
jgi:hypothetical protein